MKINKLILTTLLSITLILGNTIPLLANTITNNPTQPQNNTQRVLDAIPSSNESIAKISVRVIVI